MDDFDREYPDFDWRNIPMSSHPDGYECRCPNHELQREKLNIMKNTGNGAFVVHACPHHHKIWRKNISNSSLWTRITTWLDDFLGYVRIVELSSMNHDSCYFCKYGSQKR